MSTEPRYEVAEFGEPLDLEEQLLRIRVFPHGKRCKLKLERLNPPIVVTRQKLVDTETSGGEDICASTT